MPYSFSTSSENNLRGVHPDLVKVMRRALELSKVDFGITQGVRTWRQQQELIAAGASQTTNSRHIPANNVSGMACAVDVLAYVGGSPTWKMEFYRKIAQAVFRASIEMGIQVEWGGHWGSLVDGPHYQLSWRDYP